MRRSTESHESAGSPEVVISAVEHATEIPGDFRLAEGDYAEDAPNNGEVFPLIQRRILNLWKAGVPAVGSWYVNEDEERRYGIFVKEIEPPRTVGIVAGKAVVGATVQMPPFPRINHQ